MDNYTYENETRDASSHYEISKAAENVIASRQQLGWEYVPSGNALTTNSGKVIILLTFRKPK